MRGYSLLLAVLLVAPGAAAQQQQQQCSLEGGGYKINVPCPDDRGADGEEPWWATNAFQAVLAVIGLVGSASAGGYTIWRLRSRRRALTSLLTAIETTYAQAKSDPDAGIARLAALRAEVRDRHQRGKLDDAHFLELDKRATGHLVKLRLLEIDRRFATLPPLLLAEIRRLLADGVLSSSEADLIEVRAAVFRIPDASRAELVELARRWASEDAQGAHEAAPAAA